jgi:hypothetical protein
MALSVEPSSHPRAAGPRAARGARTEEDNYQRGLDGVIRPLGPQGGGPGAVPFNRGTP